MALTADLWTSRNHKRFLGITCSYVDPNFILKEVIFAIEYIQYPHTAKHIAECFENILKQWKIRYIKTTITTDNGANMKKSVKLLNEINWIIDDLQLFSVVNSPLFRIFCNELDPAFVVSEAKL